MNRQISNGKSVEWDVIIVGAGPAGSVAAITLARKNWKVLLVEKRTCRDFTLGESLPPVSIGLLEHFLGPIESTPNGILSKTNGNVSCWESVTPQISDFFFTPKGYGLCINRRRFDEELQNMAQNSGASLVTGTQLSHCQRLAKEQIWHVETVNDLGKQSYDARYLLDCSGRRAVVAKALGIERENDDKLFAFAQRFESLSAKDQDCYTRIEAGQNGWWYSNKLPENEKTKETGIRERLVVFHTDKDSAVAKQAASTTGFLDLLSQSALISNYLKDHSYKPTGNIRGAAAGGERLREFCGEGWLAVGDAAQAYDPLSSQGIYKALNSACSAGQLLDHALTEAKSNSASDSDQFFLNRYSQGQTELWKDYIKQHNYYYSCQNRWQDQPFWSSRRLNAQDDSESTLLRGAL